MDPRRSWSRLPSPFRLHARRQAARTIHDKEALKKLFDTLGPRYADRAGGYMRILKLGRRKGDGAEIALVQLIEQ